MTGSFLQFAELCDRLAATTKKLEKRALIAEYLQAQSLSDAARAALYLAGSAFAETDRRVLNIGGALLSKALAQVSRATSEAMHAAYRRHGDLGAAAQDLLAGSRHRASPLVPSLTLEQLEETFNALAAARGPAAKLPLLLPLLQSATPVEVKYLLKLISGDMRTGVKQSLVEDAIATAFGAAPVSVRHAVMLNGSLPETVLMAAAGTLEAVRMRLFHPLGFMLASPVDSVEEALERFAVEVEQEGKAENPPEHALTHAVLEDKYDGIRAQMHCGDATQPGRVELFSRNRENIGESFPELIEAFANFPEPVILDGEILAWSPTDGRALPFTALQQRLGRKRVTQQMREHTPVVFMAFDLLYATGDLMLEQPLSQRRAALVSLIERQAAATAEAESRGQAVFFAKSVAPFPRLVLAPSRRLEGAEQLDRAYSEARARGNEGVMLKSLHSLYQPGRRGLAWLKLKRELATLDVVVTGAEFGHGRRAGLLSDYTFAVRDGEELKNVGKAYSGLTDAEIAEMTAFLREHTIEDFGGFRTVEPLKILEVAFNNVMRSSRHDSGFALRFPRIVRIRDDKPLEEIDTLARVEEIYNSQPDKPVEILETQQPASDDDRAR